MLLSVYSLTSNRPAFLLQLRADALRHHELMAGRLRQLRAFYFGVAAQPRSNSNEPLADLDVSLFGFVSDRFSLTDLYMPDVEYRIHHDLSRPADLPSGFLASILAWLLHRAVGDCVYPLCFEEMAVWMAKDVSVQFPFRNPQTGEVELHTLNSRYERPTLSFLYGLIRKAVLWLFGRDEFREVLFSDVAKTDLRIHRPTAGLYVKLADCGVQRCQRCHQHMTGFTASRPIRHSGNLARPA